VGLRGWRWSRLPDFRTFQRSRPLLTISQNLPLSCHESTKTPSTVSRTGWGHQWPRSGSLKVITTISTSSQGS
jgi:hypothetical protein